MRIYHDSRNETYRDPRGAAPAGSRILIKADVRECRVESVWLETWRDGEDHEFTKMSPSSGDESGRYGAEFKVPDEGCLVWYRFRVDFSQDGIHSVYYGNNASNLGGTGRMGSEWETTPYQITVYKPAEVPEWYKSGIVYQIFPDRFARDEAWRERVEAANAHVNERRTDIRKTIIEDWSQPAYYGRDAAGRVTEWPMYGGSLKGIEERLDYLKSLGVTVIYLNPVFEATSNHRYDTADYKRIDPALGTDEDFKSLAESARKRGIRIILDGVFSHTGCDSIYFDRFGNYTSPAGGKAGAKKKGAWGNEDSPYRSWYKFDESEPCGYKSWWGVDDLPEVDEKDKSYRKFILGKGGVIEHWMQMGASGWRLDVADELPDSFIEETRKRIRKTSPDGLLIGEVWEDASNKISYDERRMYLMGDELDGTMNYPLRDILLDYINYSLGSGRAAAAIESLEENYPRENFYGALNLIGSHDRERIMTAMAAEQDYDSAARKVKLLSTLQYALPGVPCVYYGDEVGLMGGADPANRSGYPWGFENLDLGYHYRMLGLLYQEHPALRDGRFTMLSGSHGISDDIFAFTLEGRDAGGADETILVIANRSYDNTAVDLSSIDSVRGSYALELLTSKELNMDGGSLGMLAMDRLSVKMISIRDKAPCSGDKIRKAGVVCHLSSLPVPNIGRGARDFADYLAKAGLGIWQVLPLNPAGLGNSPYSSFASFASDSRYIDRDELPDTSGLEDFIRTNDYWLPDYVAYTVISESQDGRPWQEWPDELKAMEPKKYLTGLKGEQKARADELALDQYYFDVQWKALRKYANSKGVEIMGDLPMYMAAGSADVWANKELFRMDEDGRLRVHAGVPPDAFSGEGQDWGNPLYDWDRLRETGYEWWLRRIRQCAERFDILRIDHFRGLSEYYAIPDGGEPHDGCWQHGPGLAFMTAVRKMLDEEGLELRLLAEDLGFLDAGVKNLIKLAGLPGMDIWQFNAWDMMEMCREEPDRARMRAFYTGTHDNDTLMGFLIGDRNDPEDVSEALDAITKIYESPACLAMLQLQDVFLLGREARMNVPGVPEGNWTWKVPAGSLEEAFPDADERAAWLRALAERTGRI